MSTDTSGGPSGTAPGAPGIAPTWTSSAKDLVGCGLGPSRLWFTVGHGIVNEVYYPRVDLPQIRDLGFLVADGNGFWVEVKRRADYTLTPAAPGVPAVRVVHRHPRFTLTLRICPDPRREVLLIEAVLDGDDSLRPYVLLAPHLGATGADNMASVGRQGGRAVLRAQQGPFSLALVAADPAQNEAFSRLSAGYVGFSDGWQDFAHNGRMAWSYAEAGPGNVALMGELPRAAVLALGMGGTPHAASTLALSALHEPFEQVWAEHTADWLAWHTACTSRQKATEGLPDSLRGQVLISAMTLRCHLDKTYPGAMVASLSVPWGNTRNERGGYHLAWPRDLVECALAFLALGTVEEARDTLRYLIATQQEDGHWLQNQWLGGAPYWNGIQLDETAFPVVLAAAISDSGGVDGIALGDMVRRALGFLIRRGPASDQDRWEENSGITTFTLCVCIAALVAGAEFLPLRARWLALAVADFWNARIEEWTVARDSAIGRAHGVTAHFVRLAPEDMLTDPGAMATPTPIRNRADGAAPPAAEQISADFLQLVRFGLRAADDPVIRDTLVLVDRLLRYDGPTGPAFRRYHGDGYGEHHDGAPYDGTGQGRPWPLLAGERGHYELAAGRDPLAYLQAMDAMTGPGGMIPEQIWDDAPIPALFLQPGKPAGSAMPLAWAHAEFLKLAVSRQAGRIADRPQALERRYGGKRPREARTMWTPAAPVTRLAPGANLILAFPWPVRLRWRIDDGAETAAETHANPLGLWTRMLPTRNAPEGAAVHIAWERADGGDARGEASLTVRRRPGCVQTSSGSE